jgi:hypothetical protein
MVKISNEPEKEAAAHKNLSRYYSALGLGRQTAVHLEQALRLFEQAGNQQAVVTTKMAMLEQSLKHRDVSEVLPRNERPAGRGANRKETATAPCIFTTGWSSIR